MNAMQQGKVNATLSKKFRYPEGIMTRKEHIELLHSKGYKPEIDQIRQWEKEEEQRQYLRGLWCRIPNGNECHPETKRHNQLKAELEQGIYKTEYAARSPEGTSYLITKTEYDYFLSLQSN